MAALNRNLLLKALGMLAVLSAHGVARAANCGADDCGPHGSCKLASLVPRCDCDTGYTSVSTFVAPSSTGAYCVPIAAPPNDPACSNFNCGPHGVCALAVDAGTSTAACSCDPGYRAVGNACEDDPDDNAEAACASAICGRNLVCMATPDAITCRCTNGGAVVLGAALDGGFGPTCSTPPNPATACGPDACGPYGECVISQAIFCNCDDGAMQQDLIGPDGKQHPYCVKPGAPSPVGSGASADSGAAQDSDASDQKDAGIQPPPKRMVEPSSKSSGCATRAVGTSPDATLGAELMCGLIAFCRRKARRKAS
ncbi:MAG TPA: hypothetical protein VL137_01885 [Polyangiaceae bacterium]|nr:hypothetical protein [Polyangiaceae bacterium]